MGRSFFGSCRSHNAFQVRIPIMLGKVMCTDNRDESEETVGAAREFVFPLGEQ